MNESKGDYESPLNDSMLSSTSTAPSLADTSSETDSSCNATELASSCSIQDDSELEDVYADVRERMERLVSMDKMHPHVHETEVPFFAAYTTYLGYAVMILFGHIRDICAWLFRSGRYLNSSGEWSSAYAPLLKPWEKFYRVRVYNRVQDCFNRPIASAPAAEMSVLERVSNDGYKSLQVLSSVDQLTPKHRDQYYSFRHDHDDTGVARRCLNLGSYNYLGFADDWHETCQDDVLHSVQSVPASCTSPREETGTTALHTELEQVVASFVGKESAIVLNMGYNTNATTIPALVGPGDLLISDEVNHTSIVNGARASGAVIRTFKHNDHRDLEQIIQDAIVLGRPRTRRPFQKIMVIVEGIYSMEGEYCNLKDISKVCKKYGVYLYLDEAHSIGAMGATGRGCCEYCGVDPSEVDILMGTFTKSFGGMGGYIAASKEVIDYLRLKCTASIYHNSMSPIVCQQVITSFKVITGQDGTNIGRQKLRALRDNSNYFRMRLTDMGLQVLGNYDSPVIPVMLYNPTKIAAFSRECLKRGLAVVVVGFPAVPILTNRARFCISAGHTREELDRALDALKEISVILRMRYADHAFG